MPPGTAPIWPEAAIGFRTLSNAQRDEIAGALERLNAAGTPPLSFGRDDFPLPQTAPLLAEIRNELEHGGGVVRLRGVDVRRYGEDDLRQIFWGIGCHLGTALYQNPTGEIMGEVRDETKSAAPSFTKDAPGGVLSSRARARSTGPLRFHTDLCDVIALLCVRNASAGGLSKIASAVTIYNEMLRRRPDLLALLFQDYWRARPADGDASNVRPTFPLPVFGLRDGKFTTQYSRTFVELAQQNPAVPRITAAQDEALDLLAAVADEVCLHSAFEEGDIQLLNNHVIYHGRTAYDDDAASHQERLLFRLWLAPLESRALPEGFEVLWGDIAPGALRGGVIQRTPACGRRARTPLSPDPVASHVHGR
ncbi:MAG: TauD/TfdA family dioxygenase [Acetobacteraceae bacterium]